ncbi:MAG: hypothetical protein JXO22_13210 [Phycisphaerae bacterium]|nr:hypothetical protein [Phycisphaerae bacterium]
MARILSLCLVLGLAASLPVIIGGCPTQGGTTTDDQSGGTTDGTTNDDGTTDSGTTDNGTTTLCGSRTVTTIPTGYVESITSLDIDVTPTDAPLAKVIFQAALCFDTSELEGYSVLYEVDSAGNVTSTISLMDNGATKMYLRTATSGQSFSVEDGCAIMESTATTDDDADDTDDLIDPPDNTCGPMSFPVTRDGMTFDTPTGDYTCVEVHATSVCTDCWQDADGWHQTIVATGYYVAQGTLDNVSVSSWAAVCDPSNPDATVTITEGNRIDFTMTTQIDYLISDSPEDLGYEEITYTLP